jgi:two-component system, LytTR family, response regulator LytT
MITDKLVLAVADDDAATLKILVEKLQAVFSSKDVMVEIHDYALLPSLEHDLPLIPFDLLFLDIEMPMLDGISFGKKLRAANNDVSLIYVSNREDKVFDAFESHPFGFVRKSNFALDIEKVVTSYLDYRMKKEPKKMVVSTANGQEAIPFDKVTYIEASSRNQLVHLLNEKEPRILSSTMEKIASDLEDYGFIPCYKGIVVNYRYIARLEDDVIILNDGSRVPLSRRKGPETKKRYLELMKSHSGLIF